MNKLTSILNIIGPRGLKWLLGLICASLVLSLIEYTLAIFIQLFLFALKMIPIDVVPSFFRFMTQYHLSHLLFVLVAIGLFRSLALFINAHTASFLYESFNTRLKNITIFQLLLSEKQKFTPNSTIQWLFGEVFIRSSQCISQITLIIPVAIQVLLLSCALFFIAWKETLIGFVGLIIVALIVKGFSAKVLKMATLVPKELATVNKIIQRVTKNWVFVRIGGSERQEYEKVSWSLIRYFNYYARARFFANVSNVIPPFFGLLLISIIVWLSKKYFNTPSSLLLMFLYIFIRFIQQLSSFIQGLSNATTFFPQLDIAINFYQGVSLNDLREASALDIKLNVFGSSQDSPSVFPIPVKREIPSNTKDYRPTPPEICVKNLFFGWDDQQNQALFSDLNLNIRAGSIFGVIGPSGSGKSTLLNLMLGIISPKKGEVLIGNILAEQYLKSHNSMIGYVGADPFLLDGSIRENLLYGLKYDVDEEDIWQALEFAKITETIKTLEFGLNHNISEIGEGLSTGQKQRIAIARAILRRPKLLILDEATANLDAQTELEIAKSISQLRGNCTVIIVSHKTTMLADLDDKIELKL